MQEQDLIFENCYASTLIDINKNLAHLENKLNFLCINVRSLMGKSTEFFSFLQLSKINYTFIALTEVALTSETDKNFDIDGYNCKSIYRSDRGGGIKLYYAQHLDVQILSNLTGIFESHEALFVECSSVGKTR